MSIIRLLLGLSLVVYCSALAIPSYANADEECNTFCVEEAEGDYSAGRLAPNGDTSQCDEGEEGIDICCCS